MARLTSPRVAPLGTLRRGSSPRISPIEPCIAEGQLLIGAMAWSRKADDLRRDPRYVLHSAVPDPDSGEGELKLHGAVVEVSQDHRSSVTEAWWSAWPPDKASVFSLGIEQAVFAVWDTEHGLMTVHRWSPRSGYSKSSPTLSVGRALSRRHGLGSSRALDWQNTRGLSGSIAHPALSFMPPSARIGPCRLLFVVSSGDQLPSL